MLGYLWWLLDPLLFMLVYYMVVVVVFQRSGKNQPYILFLLCGLIPFKFFSQSVVQSVESIIRAAPIIKSINFPKAIVPLSVVMTNLIYFFFGMLVAVFVALLYSRSYPTMVNINYLYFPFVLAVQLLLTIGLSFIVSVFSIYFTDMKNILSHLIKAWYFASPGLYSLDRLPESARKYMLINPLTGIMSSYRQIMMFDNHPFHLDLAVSALVSLLLFVAGYVVLRLFENRLVKEL